MKKQLFALFSCVTISITSSAQSHTFPSTGNVGIGTTNPANHLDIQSQQRTGTHATGRPFYVTGDIGYSSNGFEFRHSNGTQGIGFGYNSIYATGINQNLNIIPQGNGNVGIGTVSPYNYLDIQAQPRTGTHATGRPFYVTGDIGYSSNGFEFRHSNGTQGIGFGYNSIYSTGINQNLNIIPQGNGNVGIGTAAPAYKLDVIGTIRSREIKVDMNGADFVFEQDYKLMPLNELEKYLKREKHLPEIAPAKEMEANGTDLGALNSKLLHKVEELTLYIIQKDKEVRSLEERMKIMESKLSSQK